MPEKNWPSWSREAEKERRCSRWQGSRPSNDRFVMTMESAKCQRICWTLIERLETEGDQYDHDFEPAEPDYACVSWIAALRAPHGACLASRPGARAGAGAFHG